MSSDLTKRFKDLEKSTNKSINIIEKDFAKHTDKVNSDVEKFRSEMKEAFAKRRELVISLFNDIPGIKCNNPKGAIYVFPDMSEYFGKSDGHITIDNSEEFCEAILENTHVALVPGIAFGNGNCFRLSYAASEEELIDAIGRIKKYLATFK